MSLARWLRLERVNFGFSLAQRMMYRMDFLISVCAMFALQLTGPVFILLMYGASEGFPGWTMAEALLLVSFVNLSYGLASAFFSGILWNTIKHVQQGKLDQLLLAPGNTLAYLINRSVDLEDLGMALGGLVVFCYAIWLAQLDLFRVLILIAMLPAPIMLFSAMAILGSAFSIKYIATWRIYEFLSIAQDYARYPASIFPKLLRVALFSILPVAVVGFVPVSVVLGKLAPGILLSSAVAVVFLIGTIKYWHHVLESYTSAGG